MQQASDGCRAPAEDVHSVAPGISKNEARRLLAGGRIRRWLRGRPLGLELLDLPHWLAEYETRKPRTGTETASVPQADKAHATGPIAILVCRLSGQAARIRTEDLTTSTPSAETLPPLLEPAEAEERAAEFVDRLLLVAARGKRSRERGPLLRSEPCAYPYWVEYFRRRSSIDFRALDAVSGQPAGTAVRNAIASGLTIASRR